MLARHPDEQVATVPLHVREVVVGGLPRRRFGLLPNDEALPVDREPRQPSGIIQVARPRLDDAAGAQRRPRLDEHESMRAQAMRR